ncbi:MAG: ATP-binding cassette domain-containing protein [Oscillospiraceae bacterium]|nr:ATP-binding cassette domain-containing protein [Oscillospiraceae bacterium]MBQ4642442.1 ATP-binding cassette domain-containing protein [Oscillospiraceae bacterium]
MLQLKNITKHYASGNNAVRALQGIDLQFRQHEFVSILGPSGCGKTTMLNIIGGLDQYTAGDLVIDGRSTKDFGDRDWDTYRNHSIGFVFQSYNLIPHQSVLQNVELALTLSGVSKRERRQRAKQALQTVGLGDQLRKRPGQMSGGQMQRVAIARALVNNPDIILADEPTGALDTQTSVQVMELLKEVAKDRLVIMVTHNPDLAERYSTRIIRMLDGKITSDTAPLNQYELAAIREREQMAVFGRKHTQRKPSMSFITSFGLSLKNLFTKKGRTILTSFAGSIGIIGIALIYAVSQGMTTYINTVQEDTLASYPLTIEATTVDLGTLMQTFMGVASDDSDRHKNDAVYSQSVIFDMINALNNIESTTNDLKSFKSYLEAELQKPESETGLQDALTGIQYTYDMDFLVYTKDPNGNIIHSDTQELLSKAIAENMGMDMSSMMNMQNTMIPSSMPAMMPGTANLWCQMLSGKDGKPINPVLENQYDVIYGSWPNSYNEVVLVVDENNELDDMTLYALGLETEEEIDKVFQAVKDGQQIETEQKKWTYEEICKMDFRVILSADCYGLDEQTGRYVDLRETEAGLRYLYDNALTLKVTGIIRPNEDATSAMLSGSIAYTQALTEYVVERSKESKALQAQKEQTDTDIFTGLPFRDNADLSAEDKEAAFRAYIEELTPEKQAQAYVTILGIPSQEQLDAAVEQTLSTMDREQMEQSLIGGFSQQAGMNAQQIETYVTAMNDDDLKEVFSQMIAEQVKRQMRQNVQEQTAAMSQEQLVAALQMSMGSYTTEQCAVFYDEVLEFAPTSYEENLRTLSDVNLNEPATINLYASSFENKDFVEQVIAEYNNTVEELKQIRYTDYVGIMMSSVTTIINAITYVLIAFVAISLVVSSIMIGVITLISVQERTKEIGILRAIGASKRNVSSMFNAETMIIGFTSGLLGVGLTYLLCIPINAIIHYLTGLPNLKAILPPQVAVVLVIISVLLTLISGIIPSRSAAKKDPVVALRTE